MLLFFFGLHVLSKLMQPTGCLMISVLCMTTTFDSCNTVTYKRVV